MAGGRPIYKTQDQAVIAPNGEVEISDTFSLKNSDWKNEKALQDYIFKNAKIFTKDYLDDTLLEAVSGMNLEHHISKRKCKGSRILDIVLLCEKKNYLIELKNPTYKRDNREAIGQILDYGRDFLYPKKELLLITTLFDLNTARTIKEYGLPIRYFYINKDQLFEYLGDA